MTKTFVKPGVVVLLVALTGGSASTQTVRLHKVMREKLDHSQQILEAVVTSNWSQLDRHARELAEASRDPAWAVLTMPEYIRHSAAFLRATDDLMEAAKLRDLESASLGFISLATSCVSCHRYITRARIAGDRIPQVDLTPTIDLHRLSAPRVPQVHATQ